MNYRANENIMNRMAAQCYAEVKIRTLMLTAYLLVPEAVLELNSHKKPCHGRGNGD